VTAFIIHISRSFVVNTIFSDYRPVILYAISDTDDIFATCLLSELTFGIYGFRITGKAFVYPHVGNIFGSDAVAPPFVGTFMNQNKVPLESPSGTGKISSPVSVLISISIGNCTLVLHAKVRSFHQLKAVFIKRVRTK